jgi:hypothetical protein
MQSRTAAVLFLFGPPRKSASNHWRTTMPSDLQRLMRAVRTLSKLAQKYREEDVAAALLKHCTRRQRPDFPFVGQFLLDLHELYRKPEEDAEPRCCECGDFIHYNFKDRGIARSDARYCRPACRQKAHRKRVTANRAGGRQRRNAATVRDGLPPAESDLTVTEGGAP